MCVCVCVFVCDASQQMSIHIGKYYICQMSEPFS